MKNGMFFTKEEVLNFDSNVYSSIDKVCKAVYDKFSCGIDPETAKKIIADFHKCVIKKEQ